MAITIPIPSNTPHLEMSAQIEGTTYTLIFRWNERCASWFFTLADADGDPIFEGVRVGVDFPLGFRCRDARMPPGGFVAVDTSGVVAVADPGLADLGDRVQLLYFEASELPVED